MGRPAKSQSLFKKKHELTKALAELKKLVPDAIKVLAEGMKSQDEKVKIGAAEKVLKFHADAIKEIRQDEINSTLIEMKLGLIGQGSTAQEDNTPQLNFDEIHSDFRDNVADAQNVVDLSDVSKIG